MHDGASSRPSASLPVPPDVHDVLLWRLAIDVASVHRSDRDGRCASGLCASYPCPAAWAAHAAARAARRLSAQPPHHRTVTARGRAAVPAIVEQSSPPDAPPPQPADPPDRQPSGHGLWPPPLRRPDATRPAPPGFHVPSAPPQNEPPAA
jgi:hypothetical protein